MGLSYGLANFVLFWGVTLYCSRHALEFAALRYIGVVGYWNRQSADRGFRQQTRLPKARIVNKAGSCLNDSWQLPSADHGRLEATCHSGTHIRLQLARSLHGCHRDCHVNNCYQNSVAGQLATGGNHHIVLYADRPAAESRDPRRFVLHVSTRQRVCIGIIHVIRGKRGEISLEQFTEQKVV